MIRTIQFRRAEEADVERIWQIILQAKEQMRLMNNRQWQDGYPSIENITGDIANGYGYVLCEKNGVLAYGAVILDGEPAYDHIRGQWLTNEQYAVVHRLAVADEVKNKGFGTLFLQKTEDLCKKNNIRSFRIDTTFENLYMQKILYAMNFTHCGKVFYNTEQRQAYEKRL